MVVLTCRSMNDTFWQNVEDAVVYFLPRLVMGVNFARAVSGEQIIQAVTTVLQKHALAAESVFCLAAAEDKQQKAELLEACTAEEVSCSPPQAVSMLAVRRALLV